MLYVGLTGNVFTFIVFSVNRFVLLIVFSLLSHFNVVNRYWHLYRSCNWNVITKLIALYCIVSVVKNHFLKFTVVLHKGHSLLGSKSNLKLQKVAIFSRWLMCSRAREYAQALGRTLWWMYSHLGCYQTLCVFACLCVYVFLIIIRHTTGGITNATVHQL